MPIEGPGTFAMSESDADEFLNDLLKKPNDRSWSDVVEAAERYIRDDKVRGYYFSKAEEMLKTTGALNR